MAEYIIVSHDDEPDGFRLLIGTIDSKAASNLLQNMRFGVLRFGLQVGDMLDDEEQGGT